MSAAAEHSAVRPVDVLVVGAGPAGMAAATAAARSGRQVTVLDDNAAAGGQIWRAFGIAAEESAGETTVQRRRAADFARSGVKLLTGRSVVDAAEPQLLRAAHATAHGTRMESFAWKYLILATGARERFLPFPGWTHPGVFGAGGLQALCKGGFSVSGKRIVVAGTGPLLLAVAAHLQQYGAQITCVAEQAALRQMLPFAFSMATRPGKLLQGFRYRSALLQTPYRIGTWPVAALASADGAALRAVRLTDGDQTWDEPCDALACGFHLVPNTELPTLLGCELRDGFVAVDNEQRTSQERIYCAGEPTGIAGLDAALLEGTIAGLHAANQPQDAARLYARRDREQAFGTALARAFRLRPELSTLAAPDTLVCRCEDVSYAQLSGRNSWREAKLHTRCGMGPCQGRVCGAAVETLFGWRVESVRPPLFPIPIAAFCHEDTLPEEALLGQEI